MGAYLSYCSRIVGKDKTEVEFDGKTMLRWVTYKNRFQNYNPTGMRPDGTFGFIDPSREDIIKLVAYYGYATAYVLKDDTLRKERTKGSNTLGAYIMMIDFDNTMSLEDAQEHEWWDKVWFAYTTPSYGVIQNEISEQEQRKLPPEQYDAILPFVGKPKRNFRLVFKFGRMLTVQELLGVAAGFMDVFPLADQSCIDDARIMFGSPKARVEMPEIEYVLGEEDIADLLERGNVWREEHKKVQRERMTQVASEARDAGMSFDGDMLITLSSGDVWSVKDLLEQKPLGWKEACFSPFRHEDNPSAFVTRFADNGNLFIYDSGSGLKKTFRAENIEAPTLVLKKAKNEAAPVEEREVITIKVSKRPNHPVYTPNYVDALTVEERRVKIKAVINALKPTNIFFAPEGFGKSYIAFAATSRMRKVLFCTQTNEQAEQKAEEFRANFKKGIKGMPTLGQPRVQVVLSKDYLFKKATGINVVKSEALDPFGMPVANKQLTIELIMEREEVSLEIAEKLWEQEYENAAVDAPDFFTYDFIVCTMARAEILAESAQYQKMSDEWIIIYDDPGFADVSNLIPFCDVKKAKIDEHNERIEEYNQGKPYSKRKLPLVVDVIKFEDRKYFVRPENKRLGQNFRPFKVGDKEVCIPIIYTTTEEITRFMIEAMQPNTEVFDYMHDIWSKNVTLWGTSMVHKKSDGFIIVATELIKHDFPDAQILLIGDGLGQKLNHINNKGQNDLSQHHTVIELSQIHPNLKIKMVDEIRYITKGQSTLSDYEIQCIYMRDQMHQAIGRNSGYRTKEGDFQTVVLCDPHYYEALFNTSRYMPAPWSCQLDIGTGVSVASKVRNKKKIREILNFHGEMPALVERLQNYIANTKNIVEHPNAKEAIISAASTSYNAQARIYFALEQLQQDNIKQNSLIDEFKKAIS